MNVVEYESNEYEIVFVLTFFYFIVTEFIMVILGFWHFLGFIYRPLLSCMLDCLDCLGPGTI